MTEHKTFPGRAYTVTCAEDTTVVLPHPLGGGEVVLECQANQQLHVTATAGRLFTGSDAAIVTEVFKVAPGAASVAPGALAAAQAAAKAALDAAQRAEQAAENADTDSVKRDLLPVSMDWLNSRFTQELGSENFTLSLSEDEQELSVAFASAVEQSEADVLLALCRRVLPLGVGVVVGLPVDFAELDYLETSGTQYIDTGIVPQPDTRLYIDAEIVSVRSGINTLFGCRNEVGTSQYFYDAYFGTDSKLNLRAYKHLGSYSMPTGRFTIELTGNQVMLNDESVYTYTPESLTFDTAKKLLLCAMNYTNNASQQAIVKLYSLKLASPEQVLIDLVPALDGNGTPCMYDRVSKQCFRNAGSGVFGYRIKATGEEYAPMSLRDPYYTAPSGVYARPAGENELEIVADTEEVTGDDWLHFANTGEAYEYFGITQEELL